MITKTASTSLNRVVAFALMGLLLGGIASTALAQGDVLVTLCYRNRTVRVPSYLVSRYLAQPGTRAGSCDVSPP